MFSKNVDRFLYATIAAYVSHKLYSNLLKNNEKIVNDNKEYYMKDKAQWIMDDEPSWIQYPKYHEKESTLRSTQCDLVKEFGKLSLNQEEKDFVKKATIYQIRTGYPGRNFRKWKQTTNATYYKKDNELKVYCPCANHMFLE